MVILTFSLGLSLPSTDNNIGLNLYIMSTTYYMVIISDRVQESIKEEVDW